jgi:hypothetical protein
VIRHNRMSADTSSVAKRRGLGQRFPRTRCAQFS